MNIMRNRRGIVLVTAYIFVVILLGLSSIFFIRASQEGRIVQMQNESQKAFENAEKGAAYAYFESADKGWTWFTHSVDAKGNLLPLTSTPISVRTQGGNVDAHFVTSGPDQGCYAANDGSFLVKAFADPKVPNITVVRAKGISQGNERVIECRLNRSAIYDFAWWTPYDLYLNSVGQLVNGGKIHSNKNIYMGNAMRLYAVDILSTGKNKSVYYSADTYYGPGKYDYYIDGSSNYNGVVPIPSLNIPDLLLNNGNTKVRRVPGTDSTMSIPEQAPWLYYDSWDKAWKYRSYGSAYAGTWPPRDWTDEEYKFSGDSLASNNTSTKGKDGKPLNYYNTWLYAAQRDLNGNVVFDADGKVIQENPEQIPAELEGAMWEWNKYGSDTGSYQQALNFTVYDPVTKTSKPVADTRWKIQGNTVVMVDPAEGGSKYWEMLKSFDYWKAIGYSDTDATNYSTHINPEIMDGTYGTEIPDKKYTIKVDNTNSMKQQAAWNDFAQKAGLDDVILANDKGEDMEAPRFATTYKEKGKKSGLYFSKTGGTQTLNYGKAAAVTYTAKECGKYNPADANAYANWLNCMEQGIDILVNTLNRDAEGNLLPDTQQAAKKVKFINTNTTKWAVALELDLGKMKEAGTFPANGIIYSELPVRLTNANQLPYADSASNATFNVVGEENVYLKGNFNNPSSDSNWMSSAVISKKQIYTLSSDFNDPQVTPALVNYPNYPNVYVKVDANGNLVEANPSAGGGQWRSYSSYLPGSPQRDQAYNLMSAINSDWRNTFNKNDPSGSSLYTVNSTHPIINGKTAGAMPNRVQNNQTYNVLLASYYNGKDPGIPSGVNLERWINNSGSTRTKSMKGAYFQLEKTAEDDPDRFVALASDGPTDFFSYAPMRGGYILENSPYNPRAYDARFRNPNLAKNKAIFFGGGDASWREIPYANF